MRQTLTGKNIPHSDLSEKLRISGLRAVKFRPVFLSRTLGQLLSLFFSFSHLLVGVTDEHILVISKGNPICDRYIRIARLASNDFLRSIPWFCDDSQLSVWAACKAQVPKENAQSKMLSLMKRLEAESTLGHKGYFLLAYQWQALTRKLAACST